jgi:hypothetical protein
MLDWALRYLKMGWPVIPLKGKIPLTKSGSKDATLNESQARAWWQEWPNANVGLGTGHRWFAIDIDLKSGGQETWDMLKYQHGQLPDTAEQITGAAAAGPIAAVDSIFHRVAGSVANAEATVQQAGQGALKSSIVVSDFNAGIDIAQTVLAARGEKMVYDAAALQAAIDAQTAAFNAFATLKASFKIVPIVEAKSAAA